MGFLRQAAKPQHSTPLPVISSIWKAECDWKCSQGQKLKRAFIWVSQLCSDPVLPPTQNDYLHTFLLPASVHLHPNSAAVFAEVLGCTLQPGLLSVNVRPQKLTSAPLLEHLLLFRYLQHSPGVFPPSMSNSDFVGSVAQLGRCRGG